jgi:hypothetical protein
VCTRDLVRIDLVLPENHFAQNWIGNNGRRHGLQERAARQGTRFLPTIEPVPRRNESHLAIPLATGGPR